MTTPKRTLAAHITERHRSIHLTSNMTMDDLRRVHRNDHWRSVLSHFHWNGTDEDRNFGPGSRPEGWSTGLDVRERNPS
jgi:hypothetical protein